MASTRKPLRNGGSAVRSPICRPARNSPARRCCRSRRMGDPKRGASHGRSDRIHNPLGSPRLGTKRLYLRRLRLDSGGYDEGDAYWGHGDPLYWATHGEVCMYSGAFLIGTRLRPCTHKRPLSRPKRPSASTARISHHAPFQTFVDAPSEDSAHQRPGPEDRGVSLNDLVGALQERLRHREAQRLREARVGRPTAERSDHRHRLLLRARHQRPCDRRTGDNGKGLASSHAGHPKGQSLRAAPPATGRRGGGPD